MTRRLTFACLIAFAFALVWTAPARAEDEVKEDTPAAKAYRDAWWAETGAGALDKALEGYRRAVQAQGSARIRARALYRSGLVLQRMGKMDEALRAMKRLATDFPEQNALLAQAKQRLDEWTAINLRESFPEWYRRYQYSPEFQAKIVDLVLKLGAQDHRIQREAKQELITIGEPALAALKAHAGSANVSIRRAVLNICIELDQLPPAATLFKSTGWSNSAKFWDMIRKTNEEQRVPYFAAIEANPKDWRGKLLDAGLRGPEHILEVLHEKFAGSHTVHGLLEPWIGNDPSPEFIAALRGAVGDETLSDAVRAALASRLLVGSTQLDGAEPQRFGVGAKELIAWAQSDALAVRKVAWGYMRGAAISDPAGVDVVAQTILDQAHASENAKELSAALWGLLRMQPASFDTTKAVAATMRLLEAYRLNGLDSYPLGNWGKAGRGSPALPRQVVAQALLESTSPHAQGSINTWFHTVGGNRNPDAITQLRTWAIHAKDRNARREAVTLAARYASSDPLAITAPIAEEGADNQIAFSLFNGLQTNQNLKRMAWDVESITRLVEAAVLASGKSSGLRSYGATLAGRRVKAQTRFSSTPTNVLAQLLYTPEILPLFFDAAAENPGRFSPFVWLILGEGWNAEPKHRAMALAALKRGWAAWTPSQRARGLGVLLAPNISARGDEELEAAVRGFLATPDNDPSVRNYLLTWVGRLSLEDVRGAFDLAKVDELDSASSLIRRLPATKEVYDAFVHTLRKDGKHYHALYQHFRQSTDAAIVQDLVRRLLAHEVQTANDLATKLLDRRGDAKDLPVWIESLKHPQASVRRMAANRLGRLYNQAAIKALAHAVDDADPDVRDAALASLERIEKTEKQKEHWRKFAEGKDSK